METSEIRSLIKRGDIEKAIKATLLITEKMELNETAYAISARYRKYKKDLIIGILSPSEDTIAFATITSNLLSLLHEYEEEYSRSVRNVKESVGQVFISYAWGGESEAITNAIVSALKDRNIVVVHDKTDMKFKSSIKDFMQTIGKGKCIILVISDHYLKSKSCLFELLQIASQGEFAKRIFPVLLKDANIFDTINLIGYVKYWEIQMAELESAMKEVSIANLQGIREDLDLYYEIRAFLPQLINKIRDMNTLTAEVHQRSNFEQLYEAIAQNIN
ncbi:TIR domain-containing protein [Mucilaginibacter lappiensis]|uniref:TIR domain-containing protein n=1 Tax=Mucilaginibacter lappiensis TaxID=354630 RepID=UPI003D1C2D8B